MSYARLRCRRADRGAAAVEFALVVPLFLLIVFGIIDYGYMLSFRQSISQAASEAARAAAIAPSTSNRQAIAYSSVSDVMGDACNSAYLTCSVTQTAGLLSVTVTSEYGDDPRRLKLLGLGMVLPQQLSYTATAQASQ